MTRHPALVLHDILGGFTKWLAVGYREGTPLERACIWPTWKVARILSTLVWAYALRMLREQERRERAKR